MRRVILIFWLLVFGPFFSEVTIPASETANVPEVAIDNLKSLANAQTVKKVSVVESLNHMPLVFTENQGQFVDMVLYGTDVGGGLAINAGNIAYAWIEVDPFEAIPQDLVAVSVSGQWIYAPRIILNYGHTISGNVITIHIYTEEDPWGWWWFTVTEQIGQLPEGEYQVEAVVYEQMAPPETIATAAFRVFPVTPATLDWGPDVELTDDDLSDSAPAATVYDGQIHVLWNHSYEGEVRHGLLDSAGWHDLGHVADCPTGSGPGIAAYRATLYGFYPQGEYPIYHLFGKVIAPDSQQFQLTSGDVYDRYGAASIVYRDILYVFWKRWVSSGLRYILYKTYDGQSWSEEETITDDGYSDARPSVAVYDDKLFLFYDGGACFRIFDGSMWSSETLLVTGSVVNITPAVSNFGNMLYLFLRHHEQVYCKRFNGSMWTAARPIPSSPIDEVRDLASVANQEGLYILWGSYYSWSRSELFSKRATLRACQTIALDEGWQWISTHRNSEFASMESLFVDCWSYLDIVVACDGSFCIPGVGCWIDSMNVLEMYKVHMSNPCFLQVCGDRVPVDTPMVLNPNWGCISYLPDCPLEPETALVSIWSSLNIVKNDAGEFCIPGVVCNLACMEPGKGYKIHLLRTDTLIYPTSCPSCQSLFAKQTSYSRALTPPHFSYISNTGESYSIVVNSVQLEGRNLEVGDGIGVFTSSGLCVGGGVWRGGVLGIAAWADDRRTEEIDGFEDGDMMVFKFWDRSENEEIELLAKSEKGDGTFGAGPYAVVNLTAKASSQLPKAFALSQNYPNPFNPQTVIEYALPQTCHVRIMIYNVIGQKVKTLIDENQTEGLQRIVWDGKNDQGEVMASGVYFYRIEVGEFTQSKKMVILK